MLAWLAKPFVPYLVGAVGMAGVFVWFNSNYYPADEYQAIASDLQRAQQERNDAEKRVLKQAEEYAEKTRQTRELLQKATADYRKLNAYMDQWREVYARTTHGDDVQAARAMPVPDPIVAGLRDLARYQSE